MGISCEFQSNWMPAGAVLGSRLIPKSRAGSSAPPSTSLAASSVAPGKTSLQCILESGDSPSFTLPDARPTKQCAFRWIMDREASQFLVVLSSASSQILKVVQSTTSITFHGILLYDAEMRKGFACGEESNLDSIRTHWDHFVFTHL